MATFLFKTEPSEYSFEDLMRDGKTPWTGISNAAALGHLRKAVKGDFVLVYHTGEVRAIVGLAKVVGGPYEDPKQPGKTPAGEPKNAVVDIQAVKPAKREVTLAEIKADPRFADLLLVKQSRLSVMPIPEVQAAALRTSAGL